MPRQRRKPAYTLHKPSGQARVRIGGKDHYLGAFGTKESREEYDRLIDQFYVNEGDVTPVTITVRELTVLFIRHAYAYYRRDGEPTGEADNFRQAIRPLNALFRDLRVREFGPKRLMQVRDRMIELGMVRTSINRSIARVKQVFKWGVTQELVPAPVYSALAAVEGLRADRSGAAESEPVQPVPEADIDAVKNHVTAPVWAMIHLQRLTGMRPSEVRAMRCGDIDRSGKVWQFTPRRHKTQHHGRGRVVFIGPRAQLILRPFLTDDPDLYVFRPSDGRAEFVGREYREGAKVAVRNSHGQNAPYTHHGYDASIRRACRKAKVDPWSPGRLRHNAATSIRAEFGDIEAARVVLGHSTPTITEVYAEKDLAAARAVMAKVG